MSALATSAPATGFPPMPEPMRDVLYLNWHISSWCNYSCDYCPVMIFHKRTSTGTKQAHAFDHYPVAEWLRILREFPEKTVYLKITGGEPFLDRRNFRELLEGITSIDRYLTRIDTNGFWDPAYFAGIDKSRILLNVSYHPHEVSFDRFLQQITTIRDAGFRVSMVNYVMAPENLDDFEPAFERLRKEGFFFNVSTMNPGGVYMSRTAREQREVELIEQYNAPLDVYFKIVNPPTRGRPCFYPGLSYYLLYDGLIQVSCVGAFQNVFTDGIPARPDTAVACTLDRCIGCIEMYRALADEPRLTEPLRLFTLDDYADQTTAWRDGQRWRNVVRSLTPGWLKPRARIGLIAVDEIRPAPAPELVSGGIDEPLSIAARSRDRIMVSGWAATGTREVRLSVDGCGEIAVLRDFEARGDRSAWRAMVYLPGLARGEYRLIAQAGAADELGRVALTIVD